MTDKRRERLLPVDRWPTSDEAKGSRWFQPISVGPFALNTRTWIPAMVPWRASPDGIAIASVLQWYKRFAEGRPGAIVVEATGIRDVPSGPLLRASDDRYVDGLSRLVETVKRASCGETRVFIQLIDFLAVKRRPTKAAYFEKHLKVTAAHRDALGPAWSLAEDSAIRRHLFELPESELSRLLSRRELEAYQMGLRERVTDVELPHVAELPQRLPELFAQAARRCERSGFDGIELHYAHAYTMASFLSATNDRPDGYGGSIAARARLPLEVYSAVRSATRNSLALGCRFLTDEIIEGGSRVDDACAFGVLFARAGMNFLSLSRGGKFDDAKQPKVGHAVYPYTGQSGAECMPTTRIEGGPWGRNMAAVASVKRAVVSAGFSTPIVACGGIATLAQAEEILASGSADIVASARQSLADPDWWLKLRAGRGHEIRRCLFTNYCEGLDQSHQAVTCQLWDRIRSEEQIEIEVPRAPDGRRLIAPKWQ